MRRPLSQRHWRAIVSVALLVGLCWALAVGHGARLGSKLRLQLDVFNPPVSAPPPDAKDPSEGLVAAYAEVDGRRYHIVVGHAGRSDAGDWLWSAAFSGEDAGATEDSSP